MSDLCEQPHPSAPEVTCQKPPHPFGVHFHQVGVAITTWPGVPMPERRTKKGPRGQRVIDVVRAIEDSGRAERTGPPVVGQEAAQVTMARSWRSAQAQWLADAKEALRTVCEAQEQFTNEAVWALVDAPHEKRAMVLVTRHGLRSGWMHEDHAIRVRGEWRTRDGVSFPLNKLVPVYASDLFGKGDS